MSKSKLKKRFLATFLAVAMAITSVNLVPAGAATAYAADSATLAAGDCYIMNTSTGRFLNGGNSWGTQASALEYGQLMTLSVVDAANGIYNIDSHISNGGNNHYVGAEGFIDGGATPLTIASCGNGSYTIANASGAYLTAPSGTDNTVVTYEAEKTEYSEWQILSREEYIAQAVAKVRAEPNTPADVTSLVLDSHTGRNNQYLSKWGSGFTTKVESDFTGDNAKYACVEKYKGVFDFTQTIANVPNGDYEVRVQGFHRVEESGAAAPVYYINEAQKPLMTIYEDARETQGNGWEVEKDPTNHKGKYVPDKMSQSGQCFYVGGYSNEFVSVRVTDHTVKIGLKATDAKSWVIWDSFDLRLKYAFTDQEEADNTASKITAIGEVELTDACKVKIDAARASYDALTTAQEALMTEAQKKALTDAEARYADLQAAAGAVAKISDIGTVELTDACKGKIDAARAAYDALTEAQKGIVTTEQLKVLTDAEAKYADLQAAAGAVAKINDIGEVSLKPSCKAKIDAARAAYDALTEAQKALVTEEQLKVLTDAEAAYKDLYDNASGDELNQIAAKEATDAITDIGEVTLTDECKAKIDGARKLYDALTEDQKKLVTAETLKVLTDAEAAYKNLKDAADKAAADACKAKIAAIGEAAVTSECRLAIKAARTAYDELTEDQQALVTQEYTVLTAAEAAYAQLVASPILADGDYYIVNAATGGYLNAGNNWQTKASVLTYGQLMTFAVSEDDNISYTIDSHYLKGGKHHLGNNGFLDGTPDLLKIERCADGNFSIANNEDKFLTALTEGTAAEFKAEKTAESEWYILTRQQLIKRLSNQVVSGDDAVDVTSLIFDSGIDRYNQYYSRWSGSPAKNDSADDKVVINICFEKYHTVFESGQTIANVPNGVYELSVQGFYRADEGSAAPAVYYINETEKSLKSIYDEGKSEKVEGSWAVDKKEDGVYVPDSHPQASNCFTAGGYNNEPIRVTVTDHTLKVGVKTADANNWIAWDNFKLKLVSVVTDEDEAAAAVAKINAIGTVEATAACKEKIDAAREAYDALTDEQKELVTDAQLQVLLDAEARYDELTAAATVVGLIEAIGTVSLEPECKEKIDAAREAYDALTDAQKESVTNYNKLQAAEEEYDRLLQEGGQEAVDQAAAAAAVRKINAIGEVELTEECKEKIDAAREAYDDLTDAQKALVTSEQYKVLTDAEDRYAELSGTEIPTPPSEELKQQLAAAIDAELAEALVEEAYTEETWLIYKEALETLQALAEDEEATKQEIEEALEDMRTAGEGLEVKEGYEPEPGQITALETAVTAAADLNPAEYKEDENWTAFQTALERAQSIKNRPNATKAQVEKAMSDLAEAITKLTPANEKTAADKTALNKAISDCGALKQSDYTANTWSAFQTALNAAKTVAAKEDATQEEVNNALAALNAKKAALQKVQPTVKVNKITLSADSKNIAAGKKVTVKAAVKPDNAANKGLSWKSSNNKWATVNNKGVVTTKKAGAGKTVTITATAADGSNVKGTIKIKIMKNAVTKITLKAKSKKVKAGKKVTVKATVKTNGSKANKKLVWKTSNKKWATVNGKGVVTTKKAGSGKTVTITATSTDGTKKSAKVKIKIVK